MVATSRRRPLLPELLAEFNVRQLRLAARLAFGSGFAGGNINRADLCAGLNRACDDEKIHRTVCNHLLDQFQTAVQLRGWLTNLRNRGLPVEPSKAWGGQTRNAMKDYFIRVAYVGPSEAPVPMRAMQDCFIQAPGKGSEDSVPMESATTLVGLEYAASAAGLRDRLSRKWMRTARRHAKKNKHARSLAVKLALQEALKTCQGSDTMQMIRARVQATVGFNLQCGVARQFFDTQFYRQISRPNLKRKARCGFKLELAKTRKPRKRFHRDQASDPSNPAYQ